MKTPGPPPTARTQPQELASTRCRQPGPGVRWARGSDQGCAGKGLEKPSCQEKTLVYLRGSAARSPAVLLRDESLLEEAQRGAFGGKKIIKKIKKISGICPEPRPAPGGRARICTQRCASPFLQHTSSSTKPPFLSLMDSKPENVPFSRRHQQASHH